MATVNEKMTAIADAIRAKTGGTEPLTLDGMAEAIAGIEAGGGEAAHVKLTAKPSSTVSFTIANPLGGIAKRVFVRRMSDTVTSNRKIRKYIADYDFGLGAAEVIYTDGAVRNAVYMASDKSPDNGQFAMTEGSVILYRFNSANTWDADSEYEVEIYQ